MDYYYIATECRTTMINAAIYAAWLSAGNAKAQYYTPIASPPENAMHYDGTMWVTPTLANMQAQKIAQINAEAQARITAIWPLWAQSNVALGIYSDPKSTSCRDCITSHVLASTRASDAVRSAETVDAVNAVAVNWPPA